MGVLLEVVASVNKFVSKLVSEVSYWLEMVEVSTVIFVNNVPLVVVELKSEKVVCSAVVKPSLIEVLE